MEKRVRRNKDHVLLQGLCQSDPVAIDEIYKQFYLMIRNVVVRNNGSEEDAEDLFQDLLVVVYQKATESSLQLNSGFGTFLYAIARKMWLNRLRKRRRIILKEELLEVNESSDDYYELIEFEDHGSIERLYIKHFMQLNEPCQKLLLLFYERTSLRKIAEILGYKSEGYVKKLKYKCKEKLIKSIQQDPNYKLL